MFEEFDCTWYCILDFMVFPHIFWLLGLEPSSKLLLAFSLLCHLPSSLCIALLCSAPSSGKESWQWWGKTGEWILSGISNHQEVSHSNGNAGKSLKKNQKKQKTPTFSLFTYFTEEGKVIQEKQPFLPFLAAHYVAEARTSKYFLLRAKVFFKDISCIWQCAGCL